MNDEEEIPIYQEYDALTKFDKCALTGLVLLSVISTLALGYLMWRFIYG